VHSLGFTRGDSFAARRKVRRRAPFSITKAEETLRVAEGRSGGTDEGAKRSSRGGAVAHDRAPCRLLSARGVSGAPPGGIGPHAGHFSLRGSFTASRCAPPNQPPWGWLLGHRTRRPVGVGGRRTATGPGLRDLLRSPSGLGGRPGGGHRSARLTARGSSSGNRHCELLGTGVAESRSEQGQAARDELRRAAAGTLVTGLDTRSTSSGDHRQRCASRDPPRQKSGGTGLTDDRKGDGASAFS
jgi:hypothetical protein